MNVGCVRRLTFAFLLLGLIANPAHADQGIPVEGTRFWVANTNDHEVAVFLKEFQSAVARRSAEDVAKLTFFPLRVNRSSGPRDVAEFLEKFTSLYVDTLRAQIAKDTVGEMFPTYRGIRIGHGEVWMSVICDGIATPNACEGRRRLAVISINNRVSETSNGRWSGP